MIPPRPTWAPILFSVFGVAGCTTGHQFSIAMTNPGASAQTLLVVGDDGSGSSATSTLGALSPILTATVPGGLANLTTGEAATASRLPDTLGRSVYGAPSPPVVSASVTPTGPQATVGAAPGQPVVSVIVTTASQLVSGVQAGASSAIAAASAGVAAGSQGLVVQASTPVASVGVAAATAATLQAKLPSPTLAVLPGAVASSVAPVQATLAGISSATTLAAPVPGLSTPTTRVLKALGGVTPKKLRHG